MEFNTYRGIMFGSAFAILLLEICTLILLSNRLLAELIEKLFEIIPSDRPTLTMNFFGVHINFRTSRRFRLSLICQLAIIASLMLLLFLDGCVMQTQYLSDQDVCPLSSSDCFIFGKSSSHERLVCQPGEMLLNSTAVNAVCFVWVYAEQSTMSIINQIGICSSVFSLLCHAFKGACRMSHKWWGLILLSLLVLIFLTIFIVSFIVEFQVSTTTKLLLMGVSGLLINVIQLFHFTHYYKCDRFISSTK